MKNRLLKILIGIFILFTSSIYVLNTLGTDIKYIQNVIEKFTVNFTHIVFSERTLTTSIIIVEIIFLLLILFYWRRTREDAISNTPSSLKRNINALRNENIKPVFVEKDNYRRIRILRAMNNKKLDGRFITSVSKKLEVSKGEVLLAAKINHLQNRLK